MESTKRRRGHPGINDSLALEAVADKLAAHPSMRPMTAARFVAECLKGNQSLDAATRRLTRKWDKERAHLLPKARHRHKAQQVQAAIEVFERYNRVMCSPEMVAIGQKMEAYSKAASKFASRAEFDGAHFLK